MPYIYNSSALLSASVSNNLQPITAPPVNRYAYPWGTEVPSSLMTGIYSQHIPVAHMHFVPIKFASTITIDRVGLYFAGANSCVDTWTYNLGLYTNNSTDNYPASKITDFGSLTYQPGVTANGAQQITISQVLNANTTYWLAIGITSSGSTDTGAGRSPYALQLQGDFAMFRKRGNSSGAQLPLGYAWAHSLGSYAGTLPASLTYATNASSIPQGLRVVVRRSA